MFTQNTTQTFLTTTNTKLGIDVRNDDAIVFGAGTKTEFDTSYDWYCGSRLELEAPQEFYDYVKPKSPTSQKRTTNQGKEKPVVAAEVTPEIPTSDEILGEYAQCLSLDDIDNYDSWRNLVWSLHGHKEVAKKMSQRSAKYDEAGFNQIYDGFKQGSITINTFYHHAKLGNSDKFREILDSDPNSKKKVKIDLDFLRTTDTEVAEWLCKVCGDDFVYKDKELFVWIEKQNRWCRDDKGMELTIEYTRKRLIKEGQEQMKRSGIDKILESDEPDGFMTKKHQELLKVLIKYKTLKHIKPIVESFLIQLVNRFDEIEFDKNPYLYAFKNCVYDFKEKRFRAILKSDYLMMNTQYNWEQPTNDQVNEVASIFESIFPNKDARKGYASVLFSGLLGICPEKFVMANGSGRNCKGLLHDLFKSMSGDYACKGHIDVLIEKMKSGANPEVASFHKKRAIFFSEPDITHPLNVASLKEL